MKMKGLGRGLDALLSTNAASEADQQKTLSVSALQPGKYQPRTRMDAQSLEDLAASIKAQGIMQPILVRRLEETGDGLRYEIIAGERRWRAAALAGLSEVPVLIRAIPDEQALAMALIENIQRENLNPLEEAQGIQRLVDEFGLTHQQAADAVGRSRPAASNLLRLLQLSPAVQDMLMGGEIDMGHARALLPLSGGLQHQVARKIVDKGLSVREVEKQVQAALNQPKPQPEKEPDRDLERLEEELSDLLGAVVSIKASSKGAGKLSIEFGNLDQLEGIIERIKAD